jgi:hypothetical protein
MKADELYRTVLGTWVHIVGFMFPRLSRKIREALADPDATEADYADLINAVNRCGGPKIGTEVGKEQEESLPRKPEETPHVPKGKPGRPGYPLEALEYARELRGKNPGMKTAQVRRLCLEKFSRDELPPDTDSFRRWLNRKRAKRAN